MQLLFNVFKTGGMYWKKKPNKQLRDLFPLGCAFLPRAFFLFLLKKVTVENHFETCFMLGEQ